MQPWMMRMLICTPLRLVFCNRRGNRPSLAVQSRPRLGPEIHDSTPANAPNATSRLMTLVSHPTR